MQQSKKLLNQTFKLGDLELKNRFAMAPLTRCRGDPKTGIPNDLMAEYYKQRSTFGLILTECSQISEISNAFPGSGGIYNKEQAAGWKKIVEQVHQQNSKIILQIWHCGRAVPSEFIGGQQPISSSAVAIREPHSYTKQPHPVPKEMTESDIKQVIDQFRQGAEFAKEVGFDGIQLHGANGYLVDQFLRDGVNQRTDNYGGSIENRSRFLLEVIDALSSVFGPNRTSVRLSPTGRFGDMYDSNPLELMKYVLKQLEERKLQFVEIKRHGQMEIQKVNEKDATLDDKGRTLPDQQIPDFFSTLRKYYNGIIMGNDGFDTKEAENLIKKGDVDIVSFGRLAINNPDLPERYENDWEYNTDYDYSTFWVPGEKGYTDLLPYKEWKETLKK